MEISKARTRVRTPAVLAVALGAPAAILAAAFLTRPLSDAAASGRSSVQSAGHSATAVASSAHLFAAITVVIGAAALGGRVAAALKQPPVIGEMVAGLMLGPSLLGRIDPGAMHALFPATVLPMLHGLAELGLVLFMFEVGREFGGLRGRAVASQGMAIAASSLLLPFAVGALLAVNLPDGYPGTNANHVAFAVFLGCAVSVTAFPVLARILGDMGLSATRVGRLSLFAAAVGDGGAWLLLTVALAATRGTQLREGGRTLVLALLVAAVIVGPGRSLLARAAARAHSRDVEAPASADPAAWTVVLVIGVAAVCALTAAIGVHEILGGFLAGIACPRSFRPVDLAARRLAEVTRGALLPVFFAGFGLTVDISSLPRSGATLGIGALLLGGALVSKLVGPAVSGWLTGLSGRDATALGVALNARGLTELVVLQVGWQAGLISAPLLAMLTLITVVTTAMTGPLLRALGYGRIRNGRTAAHELADVVIAPPEVGAGADTQAAATAAAAATSAPAALQPSLSGRGVT